MNTETEKEPIVKFTDVCFSFGKNKIFENLSFEGYKGEILTIVGPS